MVGFQHLGDAGRFLHDLRERFAKINLELHPDKTRLVEFGRFAAPYRKERGVAKPDSVASDVLGVSGRAMLRALVAGERDPEVLADLARGTLRKKIALLRQALYGRFTAHHALLVRLAMDHLEHLLAEQVPGDHQDAG